jgi:hypothetical protein
VVLLPFAPDKAPDAAAWNGGPWKPQDDGSLQCDPGKGSIRTKQSFGDIRLHVEFWLPLMADSFGQGRANSGVIINNIYEVQVLDSFGLVPSAGDCAAIYSQTRPKVNASFPPEQWQTYDITFRAPRMDPDGSVKGPRDGGAQRDKSAGRCPDRWGDGWPRTRQAASQRGHWPVAVAGPRQPRPLPECLVGRTPKMTARSTWL